MFDAVRPDSALSSRDILSRPCIFLRSGRMWKKPLTSRTSWLTTCYSFRSCASALIPMTCTRLWPKWRMERSGPEAQPDGDAYNFVIALCALNRRVPAALKHFQSMQERKLVPSKPTYNELLRVCAHAHITVAADDIIKQLEAHEMVPSMQTLAELAIAATEVDDAECALTALQHLNKPKSLQPLLIDKGTVVAILGTANAELAEEAWEILKVSVGSPHPASCMALLHALSTSQEFDAAFLALAEMQSLFGSPQNAEELEILSPFSSLRPLVLALSQLGPAGLDEAYIKLAEMHANGQPVPLAAVNCVILGCANIWDADRAYQTFNSIEGTFELRPDVHSMNSLLEAFGKNSKTVVEVHIKMVLSQNASEAASEKVTPETIC